MPRRDLRARCWAGSVTDALGLLVVHDEEAGVAALAPSAETHRREAAGGKAPRLDLQDVDGNPVSFDDFSGHKRVLVTWASWCGCRHELGGWQQLQDELADSGLKLFSVALDDDPEDTRPWIEAARADVPGRGGHRARDRRAVRHHQRPVGGVGRRGRQRREAADDRARRRPVRGVHQDLERAAPRRAAPVGPRRRAARERQGRAARAHRRRAAGARRAPGRRAPPARTATPRPPSGTSRPRRSWRRGTGPCAAAASR